MRGTLRVDPTRVHAQTKRASSANSVIRSGSHSSPSATAPVSSFPRLSEIGIHSTTSVAARHGAAGGPPKHSTSPPLPRYDMRGADLRQLRWMNQFQELGGSKQNQVACSSNVDWRKHSAPSPRSGEPPLSFVGNMLNDLAGKAVRKNHGRCKSASDFKSTENGQLHMPPVSGEGRSKNTRSWVSQAKEERSREPLKLDKYPQKTLLSVVENISKQERTTKTNRALQLEKVPLKNLLRDLGDIQGSTTVGRGLQPEKLMRKSLLRNGRADSGQDHTTTSCQGLQVEKSAHKNSLRDACAEHGQERSSKNPKLAHGGSGSKAKVSEVNMKKEKEEAPPTAPKKKAVREDAPPPHLKAMKMALPSSLSRGMELSWLEGRCTELPKETDEDDDRPMLAWISPSSLPQGDDDDED